jgi:hypothetical protein
LERKAADSRRPSSTHKLGALEPTNVYGVQNAELLQIQIFGKMTNTRKNIDWSSEILFVNQTTRGPWNKKFGNTKYSLWSILSGAHSYQDSNFKNFDQ